MRRKAGGQDADMAPALDLSPRRGPVAPAGVEGEANRRSLEDECGGPNEPELHWQDRAALLALLAARAAILRLAFCLSLASALRLTLWPARPLLLGQLGTLAPRQATAAAATLFDWPTLQSRTLRERKALERQLVVTTANDMANRHAQRPPTGDPPDATLGEPRHDRKGLLVRSPEWAHGRLGAPGRRLP